MRVLILIVISLLMVGGVFGQSVDTSPLTTALTDGRITGDEATVYQFIVDNDLLDSTNTWVTIGSDQYRVLVPQAGSTDGFQLYRRPVGGGGTDQVNGFRNGVVSAFAQANNVDFSDTQRTTQQINSYISNTYPRPNSAPAPSDEDSTSDGVVITSYLRDLGEIPAVSVDNQQINGHEITTLTTIDGETRFVFDGGYYTFDTSDSTERVMNRFETRENTVRQLQRTTYTTDASGQNPIQAVQTFIYDTPTAEEASSSQYIFTYQDGGRARTGRVTTDNNQVLDRDDLNTAQRLHQFGATDISLSGGGWSGRTEDTTYGGDTWYDDLFDLDREGREIEIDNVGNTYSAYENIMRIQDEDGNEIFIQTDGEAAGQVAQYIDREDISEYLDNAEPGTIYRTSEGEVTIVLEDGDSTRQITYTQSQNSQKQNVYTINGRAFTQTTGGMRGSADGTPYIVRGGDLYEINADGSRGDRVDPGDRGYTNDQKALIEAANQLGEGTQQVALQENRNAQTERIANTPGIQRYYKLLTQAVEGAQTMNVYTSLFLGEDAMNDWKYSVDEAFATLHLGSDYWVSSICENKLDQPTGQQVAFAFSNPYNAYNPNGGVAIAATCTGERQRIDNPFEPESLYKFTYYVKNRRVKEYFF